MRDSTLLKHWTHQGRPLEELEPEWGPAISHGTRSAKAGALLLLQDAYPGSHEESFWTSAMSRLFREPVHVIALPLCLPGLHFNMERTLGGGST